ncbi:hypothetical protein SAMN05421675_0703 [Pasteurella multocida]|uniref:mCpol domain-containing protein n=1 Tax=Pasteurella multocida TaxID=747 RepID=UPI0008F0AE58|nr:mCpol domain-containing protein [Pasteurella multocida]MEB3507136.1 mCpol domain-containing protein [Pasteurella multocida]WRJ99029.1 mCpol domain-containing protein [Pasteurella multocida]SFO87719.1 hypothetical protein SAMN05421675_0703 [Pasteurella multocida]VEE37592.1 Uncharacterised protein [Pasteurella multocida subsp. gallicida]
MSLFYAIDGDDIGKKLERYILLNDIPGLIFFSHQIHKKLDSMRKYVLKNDGNIIMCAGDSILFSICSEIEIPNFLSSGDITFSIGIGSSASNAMLALKKAKGLGKNRLERILGDSI